MRGLRAGAEDQIFSELMVEAPSEFSGDRSMFEKLVRAQHYGLPTRLLDVALNPLVALYFACNEMAHHNEVGVVKVFDFVEARVKFADSDTISLLCNLSRLTDDERQELIARRPRTRRPSDEVLEEFRELPSVQRLMQFVRIEKPYFLNLVRPADLFRYFFVYPAKTNRRVIAQSGAFVAAGLLEYNSPETSAGFEQRQIEIPAAAKSVILGQLDTININVRTMFPEIESVSRYIRERWQVRPNE